MKTALYIVGALVLVLVGFIVWHKKPSDLGAGDSLSNGLASAGIQKQPDCGCEARQSALNELIPY
jgi:hypothetical protein